MQKPFADYNQQISRLKSKNMIIEKHIKSSISYHFTDLYENGIPYYQDVPITLKCVLPQDGFRAFYYGFKKIIKTYDPDSNIMKAMEFPEN